MNITDKAIEAAARAMYDWSAEWGDPDCSVPWEEQESEFKDELRKMVGIPLGAAAPFIAAQTLRDAAEGVGTWVDPRAVALSDPDAQVARGYLRARADEVEGK